MPALGKDQQAKKRQHQDGQQNHHRVDDPQADRHVAGKALRVLRPDVQRPAQKAEVSKLHIQAAGGRHGVLAALFKVPGYRRVAQRVPFRIRHHRVQVQAVAPPGHGPDQDELRHVPRTRRRGRVGLRRGHGGRGRRGCRFGLLGRGKADGAKALGLLLERIAGHDRFKGIGPLLEARPDLKAVVSDVHRQAQRLGFVLVIRDEVRRKAQIVFIVPGFHIPRREAGVEGHRFHRVKLVALPVHVQRHREIGVVDHVDPDPVAGDSAGLQGPFTGNDVHELDRREGLVLLQIRLIRVSVRRFEAGLRCVSLDHDVDLFNAKARHLKRSLQHALRREHAVRQRDGGASVDQFVEDLEHPVQVLGSAHLGEDAAGLAGDALHLRAVGRAVAVEADAVDGDLGFRGTADRLVPHIGRLFGHGVGVHGGVSVAEQDDHRRNLRVSLLLQAVQRGVKSRADVGPAARRRYISDRLDNDILFLRSGHRLRSDLPVDTGGEDDAAEEVSLIRQQVIEEPDRLIAVAAGVGLVHRNACIQDQLHIIAVCRIRRDRPGRQRRRLRGRAQRQQQRQNQKQHRQHCQSSFSHVPASFPVRKHCIMLSVPVQEGWKCVNSYVIM